MTAEELKAELSERGVPALVVIEAGAQMLLESDPAAAQQLATFSMPAWPAVPNG